MFSVFEVEAMFCTLQVHRRLLATDADFRGRVYAEPHNCMLLAVYQALGTMYGTRVCLNNQVAENRGCPSARQQTGQRKTFCGNTSRLYLNTAWPAHPRYPAPTTYRSCSPPFMVASTLPPEEAAPNRSPVLSTLRAQERSSIFADVESNAEWERPPAGANACTLHSCNAAHATPRVAARCGIMAGGRNEECYPVAVLSGLSRRDAQRRSSV